MQIRITKPASLSQRDLRHWLQLVEGSDEFSSPYFHPNFTLDVATIRDDVEVAVLSDGDDTTAFFPFQRCGSSARPVGGLLSDAHGVIRKPGVEIDLTALLRACGLNSWNYHYQVESQIPGEEWKPEIAPAAVLNTTGGFNAYKARLASFSVIKQTQRKRRKLERECGELRFEWNSRREDVFERLLEWKSQQYQQSNVADVFAFDWPRQLLKQTWSHESPAYRGIMSVLYCREQPAAIHFALQAGRVLHQWFPTYDPNLQQYSVGMIHLLQEVEVACENGIERIDMGRSCHYKSRVATDYVNVAEGCVDLRPVTRALKRGYRQTFEWLRHSPLRSVALTPGRMIRRIIEQKQFQ